VVDDYASAHLKHVTRAKRLEHPGEGGLRPDSRTPIIQ
jgi:hypothetical protein